VKRLSIFDKIVFIINTLAALLLLAACAVPNISSGQFSFLSFLSLAVPLLVGVNVLFCLYWALKRRRHLWLSLFVLVFGYFTLGTFLKFKFSEEKVLEEDLSVMSYNVRVFNKFEELDNPNVFEDVKAFVSEENPDIICFQEPGYLRRKEYTDYPYKYLEYIHMEGKVLLGIFSKYPIVNSGLVNFPQSPNNASYADILYKNDTLRIYNVHLQSLGITPGKGVIRREPSDKLFKMLTKSFTLQQQQAKIIEEHMKTTNYKKILCGDFNNTQFSNTYKTIKGDKQDTFIEQGTGYGRTLYFHKFPVRIDFILADPAFKVKSHKNYDGVYSDHFPIMASFELGSD
jgi:endonuclease/exonuclease/phosphatase family metal-dependent hydrolase